MNRRTFLRSAGLVSAGIALPHHSLSAKSFVDTWRTFEVTSRVEVLNPSGPTRVWLPTGLLLPTPFQRTISNQFHADSGAARLVQSKADGLGFVVAEFPAGTSPVLTLTTRVTTNDYAVDISRPGNTSKVSRTELQHFLRPTKLLPTDGLVKETAVEITKSAKTDVEKARAIYEWIVDNTFRNPNTRGCGTGDIRFMLESKDLGGKCADLNALYVGLARSVGLPARDVYGVRIAKSNLGYKSLGTSSDVISKSQHCRAEVYLDSHGWVPVDPADVRKVVLEEPPGNRPLDDDMVKKARTRLFGSWEMNWMAYNFAHDVALPNSTGAAIGYFMYPQAETAAGRLDSLDPDTFKYEIKSREITSTSA
jgi:transglutaminase-like putative cysteine protease